MFDYETLRVIWWALVGVLLIGFAITDGFDMGVGALLPFVGKKDVERRVMLNTMGPHWEGNQVWLVTAGGALFAAWPMVYAATFSGFYIAMILTLMALFLRPVGFKYRSLRADAKWRSNWDWALFAGSAVPPIVFGVAFGNLLQGVPFEFNQFMMLTYHGNFFGLLNPFGILAGLVSLFMLLTQGATWLMMKTDGEVLARSRTAATICSLVTLVLFAAAGWWVSGMEGYVIVKAAATDGHRLARVTVARPDGAEGMPDIIVPRKCIGELRKLLDEVERAIEDNVPAEFQQHAHHWMILHGRYICTARKPRCADCLIRDLCSFEEKTA